MKTFLHVGCGYNHQEKTTRGFNTPEWKELRLDIDDRCSPDIVGSMVDMAAVSSSSVDAVFSSHNIEHLYAHEVPLCIKEFLRVLKPNGFLVITCPDLKSVCALIAEDKLTEVAYRSPAGDIAPIDILYGYRPRIADEGGRHMAHRTGFTRKVLHGNLSNYGFASVASMDRGAPFFDLWAIAFKSALNDADIRAIAVEHFPH